MKSASLIVRLCDARREDELPPYTSPKPVRVASFSTVYLIAPYLGALQSKTILNIQVNYGSEWVGPGLTQNFFGGKSSQNSPNPVLILQYIVKSC